MRLKNTTDWPDYFLRRLVSWCCRQLDLPGHFVREAKFRNRTSGRYSGHAYHNSHSGRIVVSIRVLREPESAEARRERFLTAAGKVRPERADWRDKLIAEANAPYDQEAAGAQQDRQRVDDLVEVTAHELRHLLAGHEGERTRGAGRRIASSERVTNHDAAKVLTIFRESRDALLAEWSGKSVV